MEEKQVRSAVFETLKKEFKPLGFKVAKSDAPEAFRVAGYFGQRLLFICGIARREISSNIIITCPRVGRLINPNDPEANVYLYQKDIEAVFPAFAALSNAVIGDNYVKRLKYNAYEEEDLQAYLSTLISHRDEIVEHFNYYSNYEHCRAYIEKKYKWPMSGPSDYEKILNEIAICIILEDADLYDKIEMRRHQFIQSMNNIATFERLDAATKRISYITTRQVLDNFDRMILALSNSGRLTSSQVKSLTWEVEMDSRIQFDLEPVKPFIINATQLASQEPEPKYISESLINFDPGNEPEIRSFEDGSLHLVFNAMPPFAWEMSEEDEINFAKELSEFLGVAVKRTDREFFEIRHPQPDTVEKIKTYISTYRERKGYLVDDMEEHEVE